VDGRIDQCKLRLGAADDTAVIPVDPVGPVPIIDPDEVIAQGDDDLHRTIGQTALRRLCGRAPFARPQDLHESGQRRARNIVVIGGHELYLIT